MAGIRINKKQRKKRRQTARDYAASAEALEGTEPDKAAQLRRIAGLFTRMGSPPKSKARRKAPPKKTR
jgi:hypothetical protein